MLGNVRFPDGDQSPQEGLNVDDFIDLNFESIVIKVDWFRSRTVRSLRSGVCLIIAEMEWINKLHHTTHLVDFFYSQHTGVRFQIFEEHYGSSSGTPQMPQNLFSYGSFWRVLLYCPI